MALWDFCFQGLCSSIFASETLACLGAFLRANGDVSSAQISSENMSDRVPDQSCRHSCSVKKDKMQIVASASLAAASAKSQTRADIISVITLFPLCASLLGTSSLSVSFHLSRGAAGWTLNQRSENIRACKPRRVREGETKTGCQSLVFANVYILKDVNIYWNYLCLAKHNKAKACPEIENNYFRQNKSFWTQSSV